MGSETESDSLNEEVLDDGEVLDDTDPAWGSRKRSRDSRARRTGALSAIDYESLPACSCCNGIELGSLEAVQRYSVLGPVAEATVLLAGIFSILVVGYCLAGNSLQSRVHTTVQHPLGTASGVLINLKGASSEERFGT